MNEIEIERENGRALYQTMLKCVGCKTVAEAITEGFAGLEGLFYVGDGLWIRPDGTSE